MKKSFFRNLLVCLTALLILGACGDGGTVKVTGVSLSTAAVTVPSPPAELTQTITARLMPSDASNQNVTWTVNPPSGVITITGSGLTRTIKGVANGTATITVTTDDGNFQSPPCTVTVTDPEPVTSITITPSEVTSLQVDSTQQLTHTVQPTAAPTAVTWSSTDSAVATVSTSGLVTGKGEGTTTIKATSDYTKTVSKTVSVTVGPKTETPVAPGGVGTHPGTVSSVIIGIPGTPHETTALNNSLDEPVPSSSITLEAGLQTLQLTATVSGPNTPLPNTRITWVSDLPSIASVTQNADGSQATVKAITTGSNETVVVTIRAISLADPTKFRSFPVTVKPRTPPVTIEIVDSGDLTTKNIQLGMPYFGELSTQVVDADSNLVVDQRVEFKSLPTGVTVTEILDLIPTVYNPSPVAVARRWKINTTASALGTSEDGPLARSFNVFAIDPSTLNTKVPFKVQYQKIAEVDFFVKQANGTYSASALTPLTLNFNSVTEYTLNTKGFNGVNSDPENEVAISNTTNGITWSIPDTSYLSITKSGNVLTLKKLKAAPAGTPINMTVKITVTDIRGVEKVDKNLLVTWNPI